MLELAAHAQLVVIGSRDRSGFSALLLGSATRLAERVVVGVADERFGAGLRGITLKGKASRFD